MVNGNEQLGHSGVLTIDQEIELEWFLHEGSAEIVFQRQDLIDQMDAPPADVFANVFVDQATGVYYDTTLQTTPLRIDSEIGERPATLRYEAVDAHAEFSGQTGTPVVDVFIG